MRKKKKQRLAASPNNGLSKTPNKIIILQIVLTVAACLCAWAAFFVNIACYQESLAESRKSEAVAVGSRWISVVYSDGTDKDLNLVRGYRKSLDDIKFGEWLRKVALSPEDVKIELRKNMLVSHYEGNSAERIRIRSSLNKFLNFLESICLAYHHHTADRRILDKSTMPCIRYFAKLLKPYMDCIRESEPTTWQAVYDTSFSNGLPVDTAGTPPKAPGKIPQIESLNPGKHTSPNPKKTT